LEIGVMRAALLVAAIFIGALALSAWRAPEWRWSIPPSVNAPTAPADNPMSLAKVELGRRLFYDADLSLDGTMSCASCHEQKHAFTDGNRTHPGVSGDAGRRNVPGLANVAWLPVLTWANPKLQTLEDQIAVPIFGDHPIEMGMKGREADIPLRLGKDVCYRKMFQKAFPDSGGAIEMRRIYQAIAAFERTFISFDTPYDRYLAGDKEAIEPWAKRGETIFRERCAVCHAGVNFTDGRFHSVSILAQGADDQGLAEETGLISDQGKFRTPSLRNVPLTAPYLHDGSVRTMAEAIARHDRVEGVPGADSVELSDIISFLLTLQDLRFVQDKRFSMPSRACGRTL
jgi:cytochrome c peroxidase